MGPIFFVPGCVLCFLFRRICFSDFFLLKKTSSTNIKFLMKLQLINSTKKSKGEAHEQLRSLMICFLVGSSIVPCFFWCFLFFQKSLYPFHWYGYCNLLSFHLASSECQIPENINVLIKYAIFSGGSPWATHIFNSLCVLGGRYYVQLFPGWFFSKSLYPVLYCSFSLLLSSILLSSSPSVSMEFLWIF